MSMQLATTDNLLSWFKPDERELARHDDPEKIRLLGQSMLANGQLQAVGATEDGRMIYGHCRLLSAASAGIETLETKLYPNSITPTVFKLIRAAENLQRKDWTDHQKWTLCVELAQENPEWQHKILAETLHVGPSMITRILSPSKCSLAWQQALKEGKVGLSDTYAASLLPDSQQAELLTLKLGGASRDTVARISRQKRSTTPAVKVKKVKCLLPTGIQIVVSGEGVSLDESIDALTDAIKEMKRARGLGYSAKTFAAAMSDKAMKK